MCGWRVDEEGENVSDEVSNEDSNFESPSAWRKLSSVDSGQILGQKVDSGLIKDTGSSMGHSTSQQVDSAHGLMPKALTGPDGAQDSCVR